MCSDEDRPLHMQQQIEIKQTGYMGREIQKELFFAAESGNITLLQACIAAGANVSKGDPELYQSTALHYAAGLGQV